MLLCQIYNDEIDGTAWIDATPLSVIKDTINKTKGAEGILVKKLKNLNNLLAKIR